MALSFYDQYILQQVRNAKNEGTDWRQLLPGNLSLLGPKLLRERGIDPSVPTDVSSMGDGGGGRGGNSTYDPNRFVSQGNAPATPTANAAVAAQSQVVRSPDELQKQYQAQVNAARADQKQAREIQQIWDAYKNGFGNFSSAIQAELAGKQTVAAPGDVRMEGITLNPGAVGMYFPDIVKDSGQSLIAVPDAFEATTPGGQSGAYSINGNSRTPYINRDYANALASAVRQQMANHQPISVDPVAGSGPVPLPTYNQSFQGPTLFQRQGVVDALTNWVGAYNQLQRMPSDYLGRPQGLSQSSGATNDIKNLSDSWNAYQQQYHSNKVTENQAYLDQMGGGFFGGVTPSANNPQWYDTTPTWNQPGEMGAQRGRQQAQNSPWGQPGAPWASQAWASGMYDPQRNGPFPAGPGGEIQDGSGADGSPARWQGQSGMFAPQFGFNPGLVTNNPWTPPRQQNNAFGATSTPGMTFGASPWGSFW